jgi:hypothetical protein
VPIFVPRGQNPRGEINFWRGTGYPSNLLAFREAFQTGGRNDFKLPSRGGGAIYDAYANFLFGASGQAGGIPGWLLQGMADAIHGGHNNPINTYDIQSGIDAVMMGGTIMVLPVANGDF